MDKQHDRHNHLHFHDSSDHSILVALVLNLAFSIIELVGGLITNSAAITSDSVHSFADAVSTGIAYLFERKKSEKYSLIGGFIVSAFLIAGSVHLINQKTVNLHMLEDTFSWLAVLIGAIVMKLTDVHLIDPILSIAIAIYILYRAIRNLLPNLKSVLKYRHK